MATIVPVPKKSKITELNAYRPVAVTSVIMKCFERLVKNHITSTFPATLDPLQFAQRPNRSTDDAIAITLEVSSYCSPEVLWSTADHEILYLPREFLSVFFVAVYIQPQTDTGTKTAQ